MEDEVGSGARAGLPSDVAERMKAPERENRELRQANENLRKASAYFAMAELTFERLTSEVMVLIIDVHREVYGVEPICRLLPIAPSTNYLTVHFYPRVGIAS